METAEWTLDLSSRGKSRAPVIWDLPSDQSQAGPRDYRELETVYERAVKEIQAWLGEQREGEWRNNKNKYLMI